MKKSAPIAAAAFASSVAVTACGIAGAVLLGRSDHGFLAFMCLVLPAPIVFMIGSMHDDFNGPQSSGDEDDR